MHSDHIVLSLNDQIGHGAFADVFADSNETVVKVFYRRDALSTRPPDDHHDHEVVTRAMWDAERTAYELLEGRPDLLRYVTPYYGCPTIDDIVAADGTSVASRYMPRLRNPIAPRARNRSESRRPRRSSL